METKGPHRRRRGWRLLAITAAVVACMVVGFAIMPWTMFAGPFEQHLSQKLGRTVDIDGALDVDFFPLTIEADRVVLGNLPGAKEPVMADVEGLVAQVRAWPLLMHGELEVPMLTARRAVLRLERGEDGRANWQFAEGDRESNRPEIGDVRVESGHLVWRDAKERTDLEVDVRSEAPEGTERARFVAKGTGTYRGLPFELDGRADSPAELANDERPYRLEAKLKAGGTRLEAEGRLSAPLDLAGFDLDVALAGANLADLQPLFGVVLPDTPPYRTKGRLRHAGDVFRYTGIEGVVGESDVAGDVLVDFANERPKLVATLESRRMRYVDVADFLGGEIGKTPLEAARTGSGRVLPHKEYDLSALRAMDAQVKFRAATLELEPIPFESFASTMVLSDGVLTLDPLVVGIGGGTSRLVVSLDARGDPIKARFDGRVTGVELPKLFPKTALAKGSIGRVGGQFTLEGNGNSIAAMLGKSNGEVAFVMGRGRISNLLLEYAGIDLAEIIKFKLGRDKLVPIHCAYADFAVEGGSMKTRAFVFDTSDTAILGEGTIDLASETFDMRLLPEPKDRSLLSLRTPLRVTGRFVEPDIGPEKGKLVLKALGAAALYAIAPPAALAGLVDAGEGESEGCRPASKKAGKRN